MRRHVLAPIIALLMALTLMPLATTAEDAISVTTETLPDGQSPIAIEGAAEESPGEITDDMIFEVSEALPTGSSGEETPVVAPQPTPGAFEVNGVVPKQITLGVKEKYTLNASGLAPNQTITYKSSKTGVATVSGKGVVKAKKKGTAQIKCYAGGKLLATCKVAVVDAPKKVSLGMSKLTIGLNETYQLVPTITEGTHASYTWSSNKSSIVKVSSKGLITGRKKGKATITVKTQNGKTAKLTVTVVKAPGEVTLDRNGVSMKQGKTVTLKATLPKDTASQIVWSSSDSDVARVSASGKVKALSVGQATITATTFNGKTASCLVTVNVAGTPTPPPYPVFDFPVDASVEYRALLIGEVNYRFEYCGRNRGDVKMMAEMLENVHGLYGGAYSITEKYDLDNSGVLSAIRQTFSPADDNDVSLIFIACHGNSDTGALVTCPSEEMALETLADALSKVPGKVIVILGSCGSGAAVYSNGKPSQEDAEKAAKAFDQAVVKAFSKADPGIEVKSVRSGIDSDGIQSNTGELRVENKFYVLTACDYREVSWGMEGEEGAFNFFTLWLTQGICNSGYMPADTNYDGQTTLNELYAYISKVGDNYAFPSGRFKVEYQHVQVYPSNSNYVLFIR